MKIFKSFGEFATIFLLLVIVVTCIMFWNLKNGTSAKYKSLTNNAIRFSDVVSLNQSSFSNDQIIFLDEVIDGGYISNIKSPFSTDNCDLTQSYVEIESSKKYVTLTCDNYVLKRYNSSVKDAEIYEISDWKSERKNDLDVEKTIYNCIDSNGVEVFDDYHEERYFLYEVNKKYGTYYSNVDSINSCSVDRKVVYRTMKKIDVK